MRKKYRNTGFVILGIFIAAVVFVLVIVFIIHQNGLRYIKSDAGIKFFGYVDKYDKILSGRIWYRSYSANIQQQKFYIVELKDSRYVSYLPDPALINSGGFIELVNSSLPDEFIKSAPFNNFLFNKPGENEDNNGGIFFRSETFDAVITGYENGENKNVIASGEIYASDGVKWVLLAPDSNAGPSSYKDFEVAQSDNNTKKYKGDIFSFLYKEDINFASFVLTDGTFINLYFEPDVYRISFDKGTLDGDLYIGKINNSFQKSGRGLYYGKSGDIYYGDFTGDDRTGKGEILSDTGDRYSGDFLDGKKDGAGVFEWSDGTVYEGEFKNNMKDGTGVTVFSDGSVYDGGYFEDLKHGKGTYIWVGGDVYDGEYENDVMKVKETGKYTWPDGNYYIGDFDHNSMHGYGTYYWISGRSYEGWWYSGKMVLPEDKPGDVIDGGDTDGTDGVETTSEETE